jgi:hypothetical protein
MQHGGRAALRAEGGASTALVFRVDGRLGRQDRGWILPGLESGLTQALEPGVYELALETRGFVPVTRSIVLHAGVTTELSFALTPAEAK